MTTPCAYSGPAVTVGLEVCLASPPPWAPSARLGLLMNQASVDAGFVYAHQRLAERFPGQLVALFSPQHGLWSEDQDNMIETSHGRDPHLGLPVYSLYADTRRPSTVMLAGLDVLLVDLQDVGTRVYTYVWTLTHCLEACAEAGVAVVVLDRPNPLGGDWVEGPRLESGYTSFIGRHTIPMAHGLTIGEMALYLNESMGIGAELRVVPVQGWRRGVRYADTGRVWVPSSPNLPRTEGVDVYPGAVLLEGTTLSEGRGTTTPFEVTGAPWIKPRPLVEALAEWSLPGVVFRPICFRPTFQKWQDRVCGGVYVHATDLGVFRPYRTFAVLLGCVRSLWPDQFEWLRPPYEYEYEKMPIDILSGSPALREAVDPGLDAEGLGRITSLDEDGWRREVRPYLLYA